MAIVVRHTPTGLTAAQYGEALRRLEEAGLGNPPERIFHVCFGEPDNLVVSDLWESREAFDRFAEILVPILTDIGVTEGGLSFLDVHNTISG